MIKIVNPNSLIHKRWSKCCKCSGCYKKIYAMPDGKFGYDLHEKPNNNIFEFNPASVKYNFSQLIATALRITIYDNDVILYIVHYNESINLI